MLQILSPQELQPAQALQLALSLLIPAMEQAETLGRLSFVPAAAGFWLGILFLLFLDNLIPHLHMYAANASGWPALAPSAFSRIFRLIICAECIFMHATTRRRRHFQE